jgi:hypothetical protein
MARRNERVRVSSSDVAIGTGVYAPSAIAADDSAARNAEALQRALGIGAEAFADHRQRNLDEGAAAGELSVQQGGTTEQTLAGMGTPENARAAGWVLGAERELARSRAIQDEAALVDWYTNEFDKTKDLLTLREQLNGRMQSLYGDADAGVAKQAAPFLKRAADRIMAAHGEAQAAETRAQVAQSLSINLGEFLARPASERSQEEWDGRRQVYMSLLGKTEGLQALAADLATHVVSKADESILDEPMFALIRSNPTTRDVLDGAYADARKLRISGRLAAETYERAATYEGLYQMAEAKDGNVLELVRQATTPDADGQLLIEQGQAQTILRKYYDVSVKEGVTPVMVRQWGDGLFGVYGDTKYEDEAASLAIQQHSAVYGPEAARTWAVERSVANGGLPPFIEQMMTRANPANQTSWPQALEWYTSFKAQQPEFLESQLPDHVKQTFESYLILAEDLGDQGAIERLTNGYDKSLIDKVTRDEREDAMQSIMGEVTDLPWSWREVEETPALRQMLDRNFNHMVALGYGPEKAAEWALERTRRSTVVVDGRLWPANAGWGPDPDGTVTQLKADYAARMGYDVDDVEVLPVPRQPTSVYVRSVNGLDVERVELATANQRFTEVQRNLALERTAVADAEKRDRYTELAKQSLWPRLHEDPFALAEREHMWGQMSPAEQRAAIEAIAEQERIEVQEQREKEAAQQRFNETARPLINERVSPQLR